jgi:hypothetical protein
VSAPDGKLRKVIVFSQIDNATRFVMHSYLAIADGEDAAAQEYGLKQTILTYGLTRIYYVDRRPAYVAHSWPRTPHPSSSLARRPLEALPMEPQLPTKPAATGRLALQPALRG